jgi:hypothetical protein
MKFSRTLIGAAAALAVSFGAQAQTAAISFAAGSGYVDITLTNTTASPTTNVGASLLLTGVTFDVSGGLNLSGSTTSVQSFTSIVDGMTGTLVASAEGSSPWLWATGQGFTNYLTALVGGVGTNGPDYGILNSGVTTVGASLQTAGHNPMYQGTTVFHIVNAGISENTVFSNAVGRFNTDLAVATPVPEPETYALMLAGLGVVGYMARRRKQQA